MSSRWLAGTILFALGFGSAHLVRLPEVGAAEPVAELVDRNLKFQGSSPIRFENPSAGSFYLILGTKGPKREVKSAQLITKAGKADFSTEGLDGVTAFRLLPTAKWDLKSQNGIRCNPRQNYDCPAPPLPFPTPGPRPR